MHVEKKKRRTKFHDTPQKQQRRSAFSSQRDLIDQKEEIVASCALVDDSIAQFPPQPRVIAIGDIHGDFQALVTCLTDLAQVAEWNQKTRKWTWVGGSTFVVLVGDMVDRYRDKHTVMNSEGWGPGENAHDEFAIILLLNQLVPQAIAAGGQILKCLGNHEIENMNGNFSSVTPKYVQSGQRRAEWQHGGLVREALFACGVYGVVQIGQWVFCHGGLSKSLLTSLKQAQTDSDQKNIIDFIHQQLTKKYNDSNKSSEQVSLSNRLFNAQRGAHRSENESFVWNDGFSNKTKLDDEKCAELEQDLELMGSEHDAELLQPKYLVVGHRQQPEEKAEKLGWSLLPNEDEYDAPKSQIRRQIFEYQPSRLQMKRSEKVPNLRISGDCIRNDSKLPAVWRVDVSLSRSFTPQNSEKKFSTIQVLEILFDELSGTYLLPRVFASTVPRYLKHDHDHEEV